MAASVSHFFFFFLVPKHPCFLQRYLHWLCLARVNGGAGFMRLIFAWGERGTLFVCFILGGHRSWCSVRCVYAPGFRGGSSCILSVTIIYSTVFFYVLRAVVLSVGARGPVRGFGLHLCELCGSALIEN